MSELWARGGGHLLLGTRQGILEIQLGDGEPEVVPMALYGACVRCLVADDKGVPLACGTNGEGVQVTLDGGKSWSLAAGTEGTDIHHLVRSGSAYLASTLPLGLLRSEDGGRSFRRAAGLDSIVKDKEPGDLAVSALCATGSGLWLGLDRRGVFHSTDGGATFADVTNGLPTPILSLGSAGTGDDSVHAGTGQGLYRRGPNGAWSCLRRGRRAAVTAFAFQPGGPATVVLGECAQVTYARPGEPRGADAAGARSTDGGQTWSEVPFGSLPVSRGRVTAIVFGKRDPNEIYVGSSAGEIFASHDGGATFRMVVATLPGVLGMCAGPALCR